MDFTEKVLKVVGDIPKGKTMSYMQVAKKAGSPNASRAVGSVMRKNKNKKIPCHRVIQSNGKVGGYNRGGSYAKKLLLKEEGAI